MQYAQGILYEIFTYKNIMKNVLIYCVYVSSPIARGFDLFLGYLSIPCSLYTTQ